MKGECDDELLSAGDPELAEPDGETVVRAVRVAHNELERDPFVLPEALEQALGVTVPDVLKLRIEADADAEGTAVADMSEGVAAALLQGLAVDAAESDAPEVAVASCVTETLSVGGSEALTEGETDGDAVLLEDVDVQREAEGERDNAGDGVPESVTDDDAVPERDRALDLVAMGEPDEEGVAVVLALTRADTLAHCVAEFVDDAAAEALVVVLSEREAVTQLVGEGDIVPLFEALALAFGVGEARREIGAVVLTMGEGDAGAEDDSMSVGDGRFDGVGLSEPHALAQPLCDGEVEALAHTEPGFERATVNVPVG